MEMNNFKQHDQLWNGVIKILSNLSYIATGAISLSLTFLGYVLNITPSVRYILRAPIFYNIQTIYVLYLSWFLLFVTIVCGAIAQLKIGRYLFNSQTALMYEEFKPSVREEDKNNVDFVIGSAKSSADKYRTLSNCVQKLAIGCFVLGIFLLIFFVMIASNRLINI
jgi:hypothetical protein